MRGYLHFLSTFRRSGKKLVMKQMKSLVLVISWVLITFSLIIHSSCEKPSCSGVVCENKGSCSDNVCMCPTGYSGKNCELSTIAFKNNTYTPVSITINGTSYNIAKDSTLRVTDTAGSVAKVSASTSGKTSSGEVIGYVVKWSFNDTFPVNGASFTQPLDVSPENTDNNKEQVFYLEIVNNNDALSITQVVISNIQTSEIIRSDKAIPNNKQAYGICYIISGGNIALAANNFNPSNSQFTTMASEPLGLLPYKPNQKYTFIVK